LGKETALVHKIVVECAPPLPPGCTSRDPRHLFAPYGWTTLMKAFGYWLVGTLGVTVSCGGKVVIEPSSGAGGSTSITGAGRSTIAAGGAGASWMSTGSTAGSGGGIPASCTLAPGSCPPGSACHCGGPGGKVCECGTPCQSSASCTDPLKPVCCMYGPTS